jgi:hypothetical protein
MEILPEVTRNIPLRSFSGGARTVAVGMSQSYFTPILVAVLLGTPGLHITGKYGNFTTNLQAKSGRKAKLHFQYSPTRVSIQHAASLYAI